MPGTSHFSRMGYNVSRGLREIIAPRQTMNQATWRGILERFGRRCVFCGEKGTEKNRGIVPDHLVLVTAFGELVPGNVVPACQRCNDSRGDGDWREFLDQNYHEHAEHHIQTIEAYLTDNPYEVASLEKLAKDDQTAYADLLADWDKLLERAKNLRERVQGAEQPQP